MATLSEIEQRTKTYALAREKLAEIVASMNQGIEAIKRNHMRHLKNAVSKAAEAHDELKALVEDSPEQFIKPKSITFHGIKLGYQKEKGKIEWDDAEQVIKLIKKHLPDMADVLIATTEKPAKDALNNLSAAELKKIGVTVTSDGDVAFIRPTDSEVDKMVTALIKGATEEVAA
jgi:hypothetical protein